MAKVTNDWTMDREEAKKKAKEMTPISSGALCPRRNLTGECTVCGKIKDFWNEPEGSIKRKAYKKYKTMGSFFFFGVKTDKDERETPILFEVGWKAGKTILDSMEDAEKDWSNLHNPIANIGYPLKIKKSKGDQWPTYEPYVDKSDTFDWDVSKKVLDSLPDLTREYLADGVISGELLRSDNYFHIKNLETDQTIKIRVLPNPHNKRVPPIEFLFRHWGGVTKEQIEGKEAFNPLDSVDDDTQSTPGNAGTTLEKSINEGLIQKQPVCFGSVKHFDATDDMCSQECSFFKKCAKEINDDIPF